MKVELKGKDLTFGDVKPGEVFITKGGKAALKVERTQANVVYLDDGSWTNFDDNAPIARIVKNAVLREEG